jgi:hypothetical protein
MSRVRIVKTDTGFEVWGCSECGVERFLDRVSASRLIGIHPESVTRLFRNAGGDKNNSGLRLGRDLFFTREHLNALGYSLPEIAYEDEVEGQAEQSFADADIRNSEGELPW